MPLPDQVFYVPPRFEQSLPADDIQRAVELNAARRLPAPVLHARAGPISVCGNGPSLRELYPTEGPIAALNGAWQALAKNGVTPEYVIAYNPAPENIAWFEGAPTSITYLLGSRMDTRVFDMLKHHKVFMWHVADGPETRLGLEPRIGGGPTIGSHGINLLAALGFTHFDLYGYDSCYASDGAHHATTQDWVVQQPELFQVEDRMFLSTAWMLGQVQEINKQIFYNRHDYTVRVMGDGLLAAVIEEKTLEVLYDLDRAPGSFDFMHSLFNVYHHCEELSFCKVRVHFKPGSAQGFRPNEPIFISHAGKQRMLNNVVRPMLQLFGAEEVERLGPRAMEFSYSPQQSLYHYRTSGHMPTFQASWAARCWAYEKFGNDKPIVITLRECEHWPQRNSDVYEWIKFARMLGDRRRVIFLRDTDCVGLPFEFETCDEASLDLHKRVALYKVAGACFFVMNGPAALAYYTQDIPYAVFLTSAPGYPCYDPVWLQRFIGIDPYGQFPWADLKRQKLIYGDDDLAAICKAYGEIAQ